MRPIFSIWPDYGAPARKHSMSAARRGTRMSIGPKTLVAAVIVVAGVIGISAVYPQVIDKEPVRDEGAHLTKMSPSTAEATTRRFGVVAAIPLPPPRLVTVSQTTVSSPRIASAPEPEMSQLHMSVAAVETPAAIPDAEAKADTPPPEPAPAGAVKPAERPGRAVVKKTVVRVEHHPRRAAGAFAGYVQELTKLGRNNAELKAALQSLL
jgi:hypothetical protein